MAVVAGKVPPLELQCVLLGVDAVTPGKDFSVRVRAWTSAGPVRVRSIELTWHGVERLDPVWVRPSPGGPPNKTNTRLAPGERYVARSQTISVANNVDVAPGDVKEFPVRVCLPPGLPPSFRGTVARIGYFITCTAVTKTSTDIRDGDSQDPKKITWERTSIGVPFKVRVFSGNGEPRNGSGTNQTPSTNARETSHDLDGAIVPQAFWMHALCAGATTCSGTTSIDGRIVRDINTKDDATSAHSRGESNATTQPTSNRLGVKPSHPARDSGSPGSPLVKCETTTKYDDPESLPTQNVATGFVIAVTDDWSGDGRGSGTQKNNPGRFTVRRAVSALATRCRDFRTLRVYLFGEERNTRRHSFRHQNTSRHPRYEFRKFRDARGVTRVALRGDVRKLAADSSLFGVPGNRRGGGENKRGWKDGRAKNAKPQRPALHTKCP